MRVMVIFIDHHGGKDEESELVGVGGEDVESDGDGLWDGHDHHGGEDDESELIGMGLLGKRSNWHIHHPPSYSWIQWTWPRESSKN